MLGKPRVTNIDAPRPEKQGISFSDLLIPIVSLCILLLMVNFVYIPMLTEASVMNEEIAESKEKQEKLAKLMESAKAIDQNQLTSDYALLTKMVPNRLEVANFAYYIDDLAVKEGLVLNQITASNAKTNVSKADAKAEEESAYSVNGPLKYEGSYANIVSFLNKLQSAAPYIVTADNVGIVKDTSDASGTKWFLELVVSGYYMSPQEAVKVDFYSPFAPYTVNKELLEVLRERGAKLTSTTP